MLISTRILLDGCPLIAIHKVRYYKREDGLALGPGPFVSALEFATNVKAEVVGKPQASFFRKALQEMECDAQSAIMIGDVCHYMKTVNTVNVSGVLMYCVVNLKLITCETQ